MTAYERTVIKSFLHVEYGSSASVDQLIMAQGFFSAVAKEITANGHEVPEDLALALDATSRELNLKLRASRLKEIKALELKREHLLTADEKRSNIDKELERLRKLVE